MALYLVTYDLNKQGQDYPELYKRIKECGDAWHGMQNVWFVYSVRMAAFAIADHVKQAIDSNDKLFVTRVTSDTAWVGFKEEATAWLRGKIS